MDVQAQQMLVTLAGWAGVALLLVWADARRAREPLFGPRWKAAQLPVWIWLAGGVFAGARLWTGMWMIYGILGPLLVLLAGVGWWQTRRDRVAP